MLTKTMTNMHSTHTSTRKHTHMHKMCSTCSVGVQSVAMAMEWRMKYLIFGDIFLDARNSTKGLSLKSTQRPTYSDTHACMYTCMKTYRHAHTFTV